MSCEGSLQIALDSIRQDETAILQDLSQMLAVDTCFPRAPVIRHLPP